MFKFEFKKEPAEARGCLLAEARAREPNPAVDRPRRAHAQGPPIEAPHASVSAQERPAFGKEMNYGRPLERHLGQFDLPMAQSEWAHLEQFRMGGART